MHFSTFFLAIGVSIDSLGVGMVFGTRKVKLPLVSMAIVSLLSTVALSGAMLAGRTIGLWLSPRSARFWGSAVLVLMGVRYLWQGYCSTVPAAAGELAVLRLRPLGVVIKVLRDPTVSDLDRSGEISPLESLFLGLSLAVDATTAGVAASAAGWLTWLAPPLVGAFTALSLAAGMVAARRARLAGRLPSPAYVPGVILLVLGLWRAL